MKKTFIHRLTFAQAIMVLPLAALCQGGNDTTDVYFNPDKGLAREHYEKMSRRKTTYDINMEGYVGSAGENTIWGFSANPQANIPVGKKADITAGISVMQSYYNGSDFLWPGYDGPEGASRNRSTTDAILYVAASYYVNNRLTVHASGFMNISGNNSPFAPSKGFSVGADYRISRRAWLSFNYSYTEGGMPYPYGYYGYGHYGRPYGVGGVYNPFGTRGWHNPF